MDAGQDERGHMVVREPQSRETPPNRGRAGGALRRVLVTVAGAVVTLVGVALLVLPGPGLLLVLAGLVLLASEYPWARRLVEPVRVRAMEAARISVANRWRLAGSVACGLGLLAAGVAWLVVPWLPFSGIATGVTVMLSGVLLLALLVYTRRRFGPARTPSPSR